MDDILSSINLITLSSSKRPRDGDEDNGSDGLSDNNSDKSNNGDGPNSGNEEQQDDADQSSTSQPTRPSGAEKSRRAQANANFRMWAQRHARNKKLRREQIVEVDQFINVRHCLFF